MFANTLAKYVYLPCVRDNGAASPFNSINSKVIGSHWRKGTHYTTYRILFQLSSIVRVYNEYFEDTRYLRNISVTTVLKRETVLVTNGSENFI